MGEEQDSAPGIQEPGSEDVWWAVVNVVIPIPPCGRGISLWKQETYEIPRRPDQIGTPRNDGWGGFFSILVKVLATESIE